MDTLVLALYIVFALALLASAVFQVLLFIKIWRMTADVSSISIDLATIRDRQARGDAKVDPLTLALEGETAQAAAAVRHTLAVKISELLAAPIHSGFLHVWAREVDAARTDLKALGAESTLPAIYRSPADFAAAIRTLASPDLADSITDLL